MSNLASVKPSLNPEIKIIAAEPRYRDEIVAHILKIQQQEFQIPVTAAGQPDLFSISTVYQQGAGNFWLAICNDRIVGTIALQDIGNHQSALRKMFVAKEFRGKEHGVAQKLLETLLKHAAANDINEIFLGTTSKFLAAHRFYEKNGFVELKKEELPPAFPIVSVDTRFYSYKFG